MDGGRPNRRNKAAFANYSGVMRTLPHMYKEMASKSGITNLGKAVRVTG